MLGGSRRVWEEVGVLRLSGSNWLCVVIALQINLEKVYLGVVPLVATRRFLGGGGEPKLNVATCSLRVLEAWAGGLGFCSERFCWAVPLESSSGFLVVLKVLSWLKVLLVTRQDVRRVDELISAFTATSRGQLVQGRLSDWLRGAWLRPPSLEGS